MIIFILGKRKKEYNGMKKVKENVDDHLYLGEKVRNILPTSNYGKYLPCISLCFSNF